ncbi:MAG: RecX family transcriptional regulator [Tannerella sp.]|jgi:regulatory protein|nr:RecX family transcriptional regulator [Tannerella sp.]
MKTETEVLSDLAKYCSQAERCIYDVRKKLNATNLTEDAKNRVINRLIQEKFIDEQRFCRGFINDKLKFNHWGCIKIIYELKRRQIKPEIYADVMDTIDEDEYLSVLSHILKSKKRSIKGYSDQDIFRKLYSFASSRGFETPLIMKALKDLFSNIDHEASFE